MPENSIISIRERVEKDRVVGTVVEVGKNSLKFQPRDQRLPAWIVPATDYDEHRCAFDEHRRFLLKIRWY